MTRMPRPSLHTLLLAAALAAAPAASAQSIHWDPPGGSLPVGQVSSLQLVFDDCSPQDTPVLPKVDGLRLDFQGQSSSYSIINGTFSRNVSMTYAALLSRQQQVDIPEFTIKTNKGDIKVNAAHFNAAGATVGSSGVSLGDAASARLTPSPDSVWAGEVFDLKYSIEVASGYYPSWGRGTFEWDPSPLVTEDWSQPEPFENHDASPRTGLSYHTRAIAPSPGRVRLNPTSQLINLNVGVMAGFGFFQQRQYPAVRRARPARVDRGQAASPGPSGLHRRRGRLHDILQDRSRRGEGRRAHLLDRGTSRGSGNWPRKFGAHPSREAPGDFQVIQPKPKRTQAAGKLFEGTLAEDVVLVPTKAGTYVLPPLDFTYFDPRSGSYTTISAPGATVIADPPPSASVQSPGETPAAPGAPAVSASNPTTEAKAPEPPAGGLGDPVAGAASAPDPLRRRTLAAAYAAPFALAPLSCSGSASPTAARGQRTR